MIRCEYIKAAGMLIITAILAVFFSAKSYAASEQLNSLEAGINDLIYDVSQSIVTIEATEQIYPNNYSQQDNEAIYSIVSSGIVYDTLGRVITLAQSVVGRSLIAVRYENEIVPAKIMAVDYQTGLAVLQTFKPVGVPVRLNRTASCAGQMVLAMGNSFGLRAAPSLGFCAGYRPDGLMQFSADFSSGAYGGGVFSLSGELIGMIAGRISPENQSRIGLSLTASAIEQSVKYLAAKGDRFAGYLGLTTTEIEISPPLQINYSNSLVTASVKSLIVDRGVLVSEIIPNSPAERAGFRQNDLLFEINGRRINSALALAMMVKTSDPGDIFEIGYLRHNQVYYRKVKTGKNPTTGYLTQAGAEITGTPQDMVTDSIIKEISELKKSIKALENRLKELR